MIRMKFRHDDSVFDTMLLEDRPDVGPELRHPDAPNCEAAPFRVLDVPVEHCKHCIGSQDDKVGEILGMTPDEIDTLKGWRTSRQDGVSPAELGRILDKLVKAIDSYRDCDREAQRIVLEVEPTP